MKIFRYIMVFLFVGLLVSACDMEPKVIDKRLIGGSGPGVGAGGNQIYNILPEVVDSQNPQKKIPERLCAKIEDLTAVQGSPPDWLQQDEIDPQTGNTTGNKIGPVAYIIKQVKSQLDRAVQKVFEKIASNQDFINIVNGMMTIAIIFYGIGLIGGVVPTHPLPFLITVAKLALVYALVTDYNNFKEIIQNFFDGFVDGMIYELSNAYTGTPLNDASKMFDPADKIFAKFFSMEYTVILLALLTTGWTGFFFAITFLLSIFGFLMAVLRAIYIYVIALVVRGFLYAIAPIFLTLAMVKSTKSLFDVWLQQVISFTLQPIFLYAFLGLFYMIITSFTDALAAPTNGATHVCYMQTYFFTGTNKILYWWHFTNETAGSPQSGVVPEISISLVILFAFMVLSLLMVLFSTWAVEVAHHMSNGFVSAAGNLPSGFANLRDRMLDPFSSVTGGSRGLLGGKSFDEFGVETEGTEAAAGQSERATNQEQIARNKIDS